MSKSPLISIITVNLNNLEGLRKTMKSVFEQSWQEFEYIIIDGGSSDGSSEFIEAKKDKIDYWVSEPDKGIYDAMNKGIKAANGEYLLFLNSGDWFCNEKVLENVFDKLGTCDVLYGNMIKVFPDGREILDRGEKGEEISLKTFMERTLNHSASFIKKGLFMKYGLYDESLKIVSDWKFFLISLGLNNSGVSYIDLPISYFDMTGISNRNLKLRNQERKLVIDKVVPSPLYIDYLKLKEYEKAVDLSRVRKFQKIDQITILRKLFSLVFRLFS